MVAVGQPLHIVELGDAMDDMVRKMVNKKVKVRFVRGTRDLLRFRDIELEE